MKQEYRDAIREEILGIKKQLETVNWTLALYKEYIDQLNDDVNEILNNLKMKG